jgi:Zn finger protein HypA/HybF involved in hydrogenase expression
MPGNEAFMRAAVKALTKVARKHKHFSTDEVWAALGKVKTMEPRALGSLMLQAAKQGAIEATDRTVKSTRPECHKRPVRVWKSLLFKA